MTVLFMGFTIECSTDLSGEQMTLEFNKALGKSNFIRINNEQYQRLVKAVNRPYTVIALFTTSYSAHDCKFCPLVEADFKKVARSYKLQPTSTNKIFFVIIDFSYTVEVFHELSLNSVPAMYIYKANEPVNNPKSVSLNSENFIWKKILQEILIATGHLIEIAPDPIDTSILITMCNRVLGAILFLIVLYRLKVLQSKNFWSFLCCLQVVFFISGHQYNFIQQTQFRGQDTNWLKRNIASTQRGQFGIECYIISLVYMAITTGIISLDGGQKVPNYKKLLQFAGLLISAFAVNFLMYVFVFKSPYYPYSLFR
ncbi:hypothetical protein GJ496_011308 [Pomphorhynchus laevis]|nr:hypothetical protein GJ496_011308 [Pomphorhynchus laevis]